MQSNAFTPEHYIAELPQDHQQAIAQLRQTILDNLPAGFEETMAYGMIGYVVPHTLYPAGYHCKPKEPLPFMSIASQKNYIAVYHMGLYVDEELLSWFTKEYAKQTTTKLNMGKSCIRFKKAASICLPLIGKLAAKITPEQWITTYEQRLKK